MSKLNFYTRNRVHLWALQVRYRELAEDIFAAGAIAPLSRTIATTDSSNAARVLRILMADGRPCTAAMLAYGGAPGVLRMQRRLSADPNNTLARVLKNCPTTTFKFKIQISRSDK